MGKWHKIVLRLHFSIFFLEKLLGKTKKRFSIFYNKSTNALQISYISLKMISKICQALGSLDSRKYLTLTSSNLYLKDLNKGLHNVSFIVLS